MDEMPDKATLGAWTRLVRAPQRLLALIEADLKEAGLPPLAWYDVLLEVDRAGAQPLLQQEIGERLLLAKHGMSRLLDRLETAGLVQRRPCPLDQRGKRVTISAAGRALLKRMWGVYGPSLQRHFGAHLDADDAQRLTALLAGLAGDLAPVKAPPAVARRPLGDPGKARGCT